MPPEPEPEPEASRRADVASTGTDARRNECELVAEAVAVRYGRATALAGVDLTARSGSVTAVVGPNGAGKSSLLLALYGSVAASGRVVVDGEDLTSLSATSRARRGVAIVPQGRQLFPRLSVRENLQVMADLLKLGKREVDTALDRFPILRERARSLAGVLSGGEQQMLVVSRALMGEPRVLLLDEMTTGLAPRIVQQLGETVRSLAAGGVAVVAAEPSIAPLRRVIDRGVVLVRGEVVARAETASDLDRAYQHAMGVVTEEIDEALASVEP
jgi:branched-chain amino acid transport system ATP-binding protein